jgi:hypothetical protein
MSIRVSIKIRKGKGEYHETAIECPPSICDTGANPEVMRSVFKGSVRASRDRLTVYVMMIGKNFAPVRRTAPATYTYDYKTDYQALLQTMAWITEHCQSDRDRVVFQVSEEL